MTIPQEKPESQQPAKTNIQGEPLPLAELLDFATVDPADIESAIAWFDEHASEGFVGALDNEPTEGKVNDGK